MQFQKLVWIRVHVALKQFKVAFAYPVKNVLVNHARSFFHPRGRYSHILPIRVCAAQRGRDFEAPDLERGIHFRGVCLERGIIFRTHESSSFVSSHLKLLLLKYGSVR